MRRIVQTLFFIFFTVLFFLAADPLPSFFPVDIFLRLDPLIALTTMLAARAIHAALFLSLVLVAATLVFGRFFCGWVCPLGTLIDFSKNLFSRRKKLPEENALAAQPKYYLLLSLFACCLFGFNLAGWFDPIAFVTRVYALLLYPFVFLLLNSGLDALRPLAVKLQMVTLSHAQFMQPLFYANVITLLIFSGILFLNYFAERFWCRTLCPLGALLSVFSRRGMFKRRVSDACNRCMKCHRECPMAAIPKEPEKTAAAECIQCLHCENICPQDAISFKPGAAPAGYSGALDLTRRGIFLSLGAGALAAASLKTTPFTKLASPRLIRPPGVLPEKSFLAQCVRCGECMKVCLTNTLQPSLWESGLDGLWSPRVVPRLAGCDQNCSLCGQVCPTGAIRALALEEKKNAKLGTAVIDRERCLVWAEDKLCLICDEQCPYNAIVFKWQEGFRRPFVEANKCNGCGFCEAKCPVKGASAIEVYPEGEIRLAEGSYREAAKKLQLEFKEDPGTDKFLFEEKSGGASGGEKAQSSPDAGAEKLPQGFSSK
jgi:MauM/NapG family ferredoxin protein